MLVLTILSLLVAMAAVWYAQRQTKLAETLAKKQEEQEREVYEWQRKHEDVAMALSQVTPQTLVQNTKSQGALWPTIFPDNQLRANIETYLVDWADNKMKLTPRKPTELELRSAVLRETVTKAKARLEEFVRQRPDLEKYLR